MTGTRSIKTIVVGVDGSPAAAEALAWSIQLGRQNGAEIVAVFAIAPPNSLEYLGMAPMPGVQLDPYLQAALKKAFKDEWCLPLTESGIEHRTVFRVGRPATVIADVAEAEDADLVIVGRRGRGEIAELMLGSVSHELSHRCTRPVLLISHGKDARQEPEQVAGGTVARG